MKLKLDAKFAQSQREIQVLRVDLKDARQKLERSEHDREAALTKVMRSITIIMVVVLDGVDR